MQIKSVSSWMTIIAIIAYAAGTFATLHGIGCFLIGTALIVAAKYVAKTEK